MQTADFKKQLAELEQQHALRRRQLLQSPQGINVVINGKTFLSFCSNDYLGLANHPEVCQASIQAINTYGIGSGASQLVSGYSTLHADLEASLANFFGFDRALLFSSGFLANLGVLTSLGTNNTLILQDRLNHASLVDGARYSGATLKRYKHRDVNHAKRLLSENHYSSGIVVTDGVFSMEGSIAPLQELGQLCQNNQALLIADDAHGIGVLGEHGKGSMEHHALSSNEVDVLLGTFGKAFGGAGAFVMGNDEIIEFILQKARTLIYSTAMPVALAAAAKCSLEIIATDKGRRMRLHENITYFRRQVDRLNLKIGQSTTPIQTIIIGDNLQALQVSQKLAEKNILITAIRPPTVPQNTARLRITISSEHSQENIDTLLTALTEISF